MQTESEIVEPAWVGDVLRFWFEELSEANWFRGGHELDARIRERFLSLHEYLAAHDGGGAGTSRSMLAAVIVFDQFSRNMFRSDPRAYAADPIARRLSRSAIEHGFDATMTIAERMFLYLPFEHSEDPADQLLSVKLFESLGNEDWMGYAIVHKDTIDRFGRFPHRNAVLGRESTPREIEFLKTRAS